MFFSPFRSQLYMVLNTTMVFFLPAVIILISYLGIVATIWEKSKSGTSIAVGRVQR